MQPVNNILEQSEGEVELPSITNYELDLLFNEFLIYIGAPDSWKQAYDELKFSGRVSFEEQVGFDMSACYVDDDGILKMLISTDSTIKCFCSFVHEFMHYISIQVSVTLTQFSISELPSIFFEKISAQFLREKGYKQDVIEKVVKDREDNNTEIYIGMSSLFRDVCAYTNGVDISRDKKILFWENNFRIIQETREKLARFYIENGIAADD